MKAIGIQSFELISTESWVGPRLEFLTEPVMPPWAILKYLQALKIMGYYVVYLSIVDMSKEGGFLITEMKLCL